MGYEPKPYAALKQCRAATSLSVVDKNTKFKRLLLLKKYNIVQHGPHGHGKEERGGIRDKTRRPDATRRSSMEKEVGEGVKTFSGAGAQKLAAAVQARAGEKKAQKPAAAEEVARAVSLPPEQPPGLEVVQGKGKGGLLSGMCQHLPECLKQPGTHKQWRTGQENRAGVSTSK